jgi:hypothetical protein
MKAIHERFARELNLRHREWGHMFGRRFDSRPVLSDKYLLGCLRYIARNPVAAGICGSPDDWPWSAHAALAGLSPAPSFLDTSASYALLGSEADAHAGYRRLVAQSDQALLAALFRPGADNWLLDAVEDYSIPVEEIAAFLDRTTSSVYRRLRNARATGGTVPGGASAQG